MRNSGKKFALCATKNNNIITLVLSEIKFLNETKKHTPPPLQVKWSVPYVSDPQGLATIPAINA